MKGYEQLNQEHGYTIAQLLKRESLREIARTIEVSVVKSNEIKASIGLGCAYGSHNAPEF